MAAPPPGSQFKFSKALQGATAGGRDSDVGQVVNLLRVVNPHAARSHAAGRRTDWCPPRPAG
jgi:hypothetical protein